jgi:ABC-2 type transport system permease protein
VLLQSSAGSERSPSTNLIPDYDRFPTLGFPTEGERGSAVLAVALEGRFPSAFAGEPSPLGTEAAPEDGEDEDAEVPEGKTPAPAPAPVLTRAPEGSKLVVLASNSFAGDTALELASQGQGSYYTQPIALVQNALDYALEEDALLSLRGRSALNRTLLPLSPDAQQGWESLNYGAAVLGLVAVALWRRTRRRAQRARFATLTSEVSA